jgi:hypothetical protein
MADPAVGTGGLEVDEFLEIHLVHRAAPADCPRPCFRPAVGRVNCRDPSPAAIEHAAFETFF